jgi:hypothetical protein
VTVQQGKNEIKVKHLYKYEFFSFFHLIYLPSLCPQLVLTLSSYPYRATSRIVAQFLLFALMSSLFFECSSR